MLIYVFKRLDKKGHGYECLTHFEAEAPPREGDYMNIYLESKQSSSNYLVEMVYWRVSEKDNKGLCTVEVRVKDIGRKDI